MMTRSTSLRTVKHIPQRTCVACRKVKARGELIRLVRIPNEGVEVDIGGKKARRGAYLCRAQECWETGIRSGRLEHSLRATLTQDNREQLIKFGRDLMQGARQ
ncbi:YlxR family protein [Chloroflexota bacterium]